MLLVVPMNPVMLLGMLSVTTVAAVNERHSSFGVIQGLKVAVVVTDVALRGHLQVGSDAVVAGTFSVAEVDDAAFVGTFIGWFDTREPEFVRDVATYNLHNLVKLEKQITTGNINHSKSFIKTFCKFLVLPSSIW